MDKKSPVSVKAPPMPIGVNLTSKEGQLLYQLWKVVDWWREAKAKPVMRDGSPEPNKKAMADIEELLRPHFDPNEAEQLRYENERLKKELEEERRRSSSYEDDERNYGNPPGRRGY